MTSILLISDTERVKRIFEALETNGFLQLRIAATLIQADQEISASAPEFIFVQSRISGFSGEIILRHLKKILPVAAKVVLLAGDADEMKQAHKLADIFLNLTLDDEALTGDVKDLLGGIYRPREAVAAEMAPAQRSHHAKTGHDSKHKGDPVEGPNHKVKPAAKGANPITAAGAVAHKPKMEPAKAPEEAGLPADLPRPVGGRAGAILGKPKGVPPKEPEQVADLARWGSGNATAAVKRAQQAYTMAHDAVEPQEGLTGQVTGNGGESFAEIMRRASIQGSPLSSSEVEVGGRVSPGPPGSDSTKAGSPELSVSAEEFSRGVPLADAMRRVQKKKTPLWPFVLALALLFIPVISYLAGRWTAPPESALAPRAYSRPTRHPKRPAPPPAATTAAATPPAMAVNPAGNPAAATPTANPAAATPTANPWAAMPTANPAAKSLANPSMASAPKPAEKPGVNQVVKQGAQPAAKPEPRAGLKSPPAIVSHAKLDEAYGKTHPGWQRYLGNSVEFKLFREAGLYRALQVLPRNGEPIPDQLFTRVLVEFSGLDSYQVKSTGVEGKYLVEQGVTKGDVSLTIYRNKGDHRMKAFVLYYR